MTSCIFSTDIVVSKFLNNKGAINAHELGTIDYEYKALQLFKLDGVSPLLVVNQSNCRRFSSVYIKNGVLYSTELDSEQGSLLNSCVDKIPCDEYVTPRAVIAFNEEYTDRGGVNPITRCYYNNGMMLFTHPFIYRSMLR